MYANANPATTAKEEYMNDEGEPNAPMSAEPITPPKAHPREPPMP